MKGLNMRGLYGKRDVREIRLTALLLALILCLLPAVPAMAAETDEYSPAENVCISMGNPGSKDGSTASSEVSYVTDDVVKAAFPEGVTYDEENSILTLNNYRSDDSRLILDQLAQDGDDTVLTLNLIGDNRLLDIRASWYGMGTGWMCITGTGTLTVNSVMCDHLLMESGVLNVVQTSDYFNYATVYDRYGLYNWNYGDKEEDRYLNCYRFLGGEVNIDCTGKISGDRVGMDVQSGNIEIRNAKVHIDLGDNAWLGLGVGWTREKQNGGDLVIENGTLEISGRDYLAYFYNLISEGDPLHIFVGKNEPEKEVSFKEAFEEQPFTDDITRYARIAEDGKGYLLITSLEEDMPAFLDVPKNSYYAEAVNWAVEKKITNGTGQRQFSPTGNCTRGQVVTFLWRANGSPEPELKDNPFSDINTGNYFYKAVLWAVEQGITTGTSETTFSPADSCTRGQVAAFLYRAKGSQAADGVDNPFEDVVSGTYYYDAVLWAVNNNITKGTSSTQFSPNATCNRAQIVTFLYRAMA